MNINYYNPYVRRELELYHHGIAGQKWGKRNGPPYPIAARAHSASEKKAGWRKSLNGGSKDYSKRNARLAKKYDNKAAKAQEKMLDAYDKSQKYGNTSKGKREWEKSKKYRSKYFDNEKMSKRFADAGSKKISRFTPEQKARAKKIAVTALKIAGGIAITALASYGGYRLVGDIRLAAYRKAVRNYIAASKNMQVTKKALDTSLKNYWYTLDNAPNLSKTAMQLVEEAGDNRTAAKRAFKTAYEAYSKYKR